MIAIVEQPRRLENISMGTPAFANSDVCVSRAFKKTAGTIRVGACADGRGARDIVVTPVRDDSPLCNYDWIEHNRAAVDQLGGGKIGCVDKPDTAAKASTTSIATFLTRDEKQGVAAGRAVVAGIARRARDAYDGHDRG